MTDFAAGGTLGRYFAGICENVFEGGLGVADPPLVDYLTDLMIRFVRVESLSRVRDSGGRPVNEVVGMLIEAEKRVGLARRDVHQHIGDVTLFYTGVFPEALPRKQAQRTADYFIEYCSQGKRAYQIAAEIETDRQDDAQADVLKRLSSQFELCAYGLGEVRREWEHEEGGEGPRRLIVS